MAQYHLAQLNIARMLAASDSPQLAEFFANLDRINALADAAPGFVWRLQDEAGSATSFRPFGEDMLINMSVWQDIESLHRYVYQSAHIEIMSQRKQWFEMMRESYAVLWWLPVGKIPSMEQARQKLELLRGSGPTAEAFTFKKAFAPPASGADMVFTEMDEPCPAT